MINAPFFAIYLRWRQWRRGRRYHPACYVRLVLRKLSEMPGSSDVIACEQAIKPLAEKTFWDGGRQ